MFVKKGDKVRVIAGKDKGTEAVVLKALPKVNKVVQKQSALRRKLPSPEIRESRRARMAKKCWSA